MWNIISCKSKYKEYLNRQSDEKLYNNLNSAKPRIDTARPKTMKKAKRKALAIAVPSSRVQQITEENRSLLQRMLRIDMQSLVSSSKKMSESNSAKSLNGGFRQKKLEEIQANNKHLLQRINSTNSVYSTAQWLESDKFRKYIRDNISRNSGRVTLKKPFEDLRPIVKPEEISSSLQDSFENLLIK